MADLFSTISVEERMLTYHMNRHNVLASNLANVDTPGFIPRDLAPPEEPGPDFGHVLRTHENHIDEPLDDTAPKERLFEDPDPNPAPDGNAVDLDREMAKIAANSLKFEAITTLINRKLAMLRYAASDAR